METRLQAHRLPPTAPRPPESSSRTQTPGVAPIVPARSRGKQAGGPLRGFFIPEEQKDPERTIPSRPLRSKGARSGRGQAAPSLRTRTISRGLPIPRRNPPLRSDGSGAVLPARSIRRARRMMTYTSPSMTDTGTTTEPITNGIKIIPRTKPAPSHDFCTGLIQKPSGGGTTSE